MRAMLVALATCAALAAVALMIETRPSEPSARVQTIAVASTPAAAPELIEERVFELPEDNLIWYTTICYPTNREADAASRKVAAWFGSDPRLGSLKEQTRFREVTPEDKLYAAHIDGQGKLPIIWVQRGKTGERIYKASGDNLPASGRELADEIAASIAEQCPCKPRPKPHKPVTPPRDPDRPGPDQPGPNSDEPVPDLRPIDEEDGGGPSDVPPWALGLIPIVAVVVAAAVGMGLRRAA